MKIKSGYLLREVAHQYIVIPVEKRVLDFNGMITLNGTGVFIWQNLQEEKTEAELLQLLLDTYNVEPQRAQQDLTAFLDILKNNHLLDD